MLTVEVCPLSLAIKDAHGNVIGLGDKDGEIVASYEYDAWGNEVSSSGDRLIGDQKSLVREANPFRYSSYFYDEETKLYYLNARYYSPELGRFLSMDPVPGMATDGVSQNKYLYARNNPATLNDPSGLIASPADDMPSDSPYIDRYNTGTDLIARVGVLPVQTAERLSGAANEVADSAFTGTGSGVTEVAVGQAVSKLGQVPAI